MCLGIPGELVELPEDDPTSPWSSSRASGGRSTSAC